MDKFSENIESMTGKKPNLYFRICWKYVTPIVSTVRNFTRGWNTLLSVSLSVCLRNLFPCFLRAEIIVRLQHDNMTAIQTIGVFSFEIIFSFLGYFRVEPQPVEGRLVHRVHLPRVGEPYWVGLGLVVDFSHSWRGPVPGLSSQRLLSPGTNIEPPCHYNW